MKNLCRKTVTKENAYEIWQAEGKDGLWTWYVLRKYKGEIPESKDEYAAWFCFVTSPYTGDTGEYGDTYVRSIKEVAIRIK